MNGWHLKSWFLIGSALSVVMCAKPIAAQVVPDNTLPRAEQTQVTGNPNFQIDGGARRGGNLFHSFSQFSIPTGGSAFFNNAVDVQNILTRITGQSISNIDGLIRANGTANLFLLNPNGIIFGPNASLNIGGSFVASTASSIKFADGTEFSAVNPSASPLLTISVPIGLQFTGRQGDIVVQPPTPQNPFTEVNDADQLLGTAQPVNNATDQTGFNAISGTLNNPNDVDLYQLTLRQGVPFRASTVNGSRVDTQLFLFDGRGLGLASNDDDYSAPTQQSTIGSNFFIPPASGTYYLGISSYNNNPRSSQGYIFAGLLGRPRGPGAQFPLSEWDSNTGSGGGSYTITLATQTPLQVQPGRTLALVGGNIMLNQARLEAPGGRVELGGVASSGLVGLNMNGNAIDLSVPDQLARADVGLSRSNIDVTGNRGSIRVFAQNIDLSGSMLLTQIPADSRLPNTSTGGMELNATGSITISQSFLTNQLQGQGTLGSVNLIAGDGISFNSSWIQNHVNPTGVGNAGNINITTGSLSVTNSNLQSITSGQGNTSSVNINARDTVSFDRSRIELLNQRGVGNAGDTNITTGSLSLTNRAVVSSFTNGQGNAGSVNINARDTVSFTRNSGLTSHTAGRGNAGSVTINAYNTISFDNNSVTNIVFSNGIGGTTYPGEVITLALPASGVYSFATRKSVGRGGNVSITTGSLSVFDGGRINTNAQGQGEAGNILIRASDAVSFDGSEITSTLDSGAVGRGGDINIEARSLSLRNGAKLSASTAGKGDAGNITVNTPELQLSGATSGLFAGTSSTGNAGNLTIQPRGNGQSVRVNLQDGAQISASTSSSGRGGTLAIAAPDSITLTGNGSVITAGTGSSGIGGNLNLRTGTLNIQDQAEATVSSSGTGIAGNLFVDADRIFLNNGGRIRADTSGGGGNIDLRSPLILLRNGSNITTNATGSNIPGGNIKIDSRFIVAGRNEDSNISANSLDFRGGNVSINAYSIFGIQPRLQPTPSSDITATGANSALNGTINVTTAGIDPTAGLVELPIEFVDLSRLIATGCPANEGNSFIITGRGGLPPTPEQELDDDAEWQDRRRLTVRKHSPQQPTPHSRNIDTPNRSADLTAFPKSYTPIIEATGWQRTPSGEIILVATTPDPTVQHPLKEAVTCIGRP
jgi:filamentous hemagglutinin family protein